MNKEIKKILQNSPLTIKWYNINEWQKEDYNNLWDFVVSNDIKIISKKNNKITIKFNYGGFKIQLNTFICDYERYLTILIAQYCQYLGDICKIKTRFKDYSL